MSAVEQWKQALEANPKARLRWRVLRAFGVLPTERRAKRLHDGALIACAVHLILDAQQAAGNRSISAAAQNPAFDMARFEGLKYDAQD